MAGLGIWNTDPAIRSVEEGAEESKNTKTNTVNHNPRIAPSWYRIIWNVAEEAVRPFAKYPWRPSAAELPVAGNDWSRHTGDELHDMSTFYNGIHILPVSQCFLCVVV
jgi:hypothetical protein